MYDTLKRQDYLYTLLTRGNGRVEARVVNRSSASCTCQKPRKQPPTTREGGHPHPITDSHGKGLLPDTRRRPGYQQRASEGRPERLGEWTEATENGTGPHMPVTEKEGARRDHSRSCPVTTCP